MASSELLARAARAIDRVLASSRFGGAVSVTEHPFRYSLRCEHQPSGFVAEYPGMSNSDVPGAVQSFVKDLFDHLLRDETGVVEAYQEPHPVRL